MAEDPPTLAVALQIPVLGLVLGCGVVSGPAPAQQRLALTDILAAKVHASEKHGGLPYRWFAPKGASKPGGSKYPLVLFLHGAGERGDDNRAQLRHGVADFVAAANQTRRPCFVLAPQCPRRVWWNDRYPALIELTRKLIAEHPVDPDRVYITGLSMGGYATWHALAHDPDLFAAAIPICGGGSGDIPKLLAKQELDRTAIWVFHGGADRTVPLAKSEAMVAVLKKLGKEPKFTVYQGVGHNSWSRTYADPEVHEWLFAQRRRFPIPALQDGDRIVFFGDSITQAGAGKGGYIRLIEADLKKYRPQLDITLIGAGISGHRVPDLQKRLQRDVLGKQASIVLIYIGINDVWHWHNNRGTKPADFDAGLRDLIAKIQASKARVILCTPTVIGEKTDGSNKFDKLLAEYSEISRRVSRDTGTQLLDLRERFLHHLATHNPENKDRGILTRDAVHLNSTGNRFVADQMLEALGVAPTRR